MSEPGGLSDLPEPYRSNLARADAQEKRIQQGILLAVVFGLGWWIGDARAEPEPVAPPYESRLDVGDMSQVCGVLRDYGPDDDPGFLTGCEVAAQGAIDSWAKP